MAFGFSNQLASIVAFNKTKIGKNKISLSLLSNGFEIVL
jgi:hypothetical protein